MRMTRGTWLLLALAVLPATWGRAVDASPASAERLASYMERRAEAGFSGVVLVASREGVLLREGYGRADAELGVRNSPATVFRIGSVTKPLVATAVMRLVARGVLSLDDRLSKYVPNCPKAWEAARIEDLLSHTSGIPDLFGNVAAGPPGALRKLLDDTLDQAQASVLSSQPGSRYSYSNFGYLLLAYVVEVASHSSWLEVLQREVFAPAALQATRYDDVWAIVPGRARGYDRKRDKLVNIAYKDHGALSAGGLLSSADDLQRFVAALDGDLLLPAELQNRMFTPRREDYALGWQVTRFFDRPVRNHTGQIDGFSAHIADYPADRLFVAVLSNVGHEPVKAIACDLAALTFGAAEPVLERNPAATPDPSQLDLLAGSYVSEDGEAREILRQGDRLAYRRGSALSPLTPVGYRSFALEARPDVSLTFEGASTAPAVTLVARSCGSTLFIAQRRPGQ